VAFWYLNYSSRETGHMDSNAKKRPRSHLLSMLGTMVWTHTIPCVCWKNLFSKTKWAFELICIYILTKEKGNILE
jgi:hypothetical protein